MSSDRETVVADAEISAGAIIVGAVALIAIVLTAIWVFYGVLPQEGAPPSLATVEAPDMTHS